jgi:predicted cupin superfamily sugar epimerase
MDTSLMHPRARELVSLLRLEPHPEGGHFVQTFRSPLIVTPSDLRGARTALTVIYFLLVQGSVSRWHRVASDEAWHWYEGCPLELLVAHPDTGVIESSLLGPLSGTTTTPQHIVPAGRWQAARSTGAYTLVGCSVGPGFEFSDFTLLSSLPEHEKPHITPCSLLTEFL